MKEGRSKGFHHTCIVPMATCKRGLSAGDCPSLAPIGTCAVIKEHPKNTESGHFIDRIEYPKTFRKLKSFYKLYI